MSEERVKVMDMLPTWNASEPFDALPPLAPQFDPSSNMLLAIEANSALARMDQATRSVPNPAILASAIPLLESKASSEIENIVTTNDELFRHDRSGSAASPDTQATLRHRAALRAGFRLVDRRGLLTAAVAQRVCSELVGHEAPFRMTEGTYIGDGGGGRRYTPPWRSKVVQPLLANWAEYVNSRVHDPATAMALAHYQFEAIHPFHDGNGRTGRILNVLLLRSRGVLHQPTLYLSRFINRHRSQYYDLLLDVTRSDSWQEWHAFMLEGVLDAAEWGIRTCELVSRHTRQFDLAIDETLPSGVSARFRDVLFEQPYARIGDVVAGCGVTRQTASKWLRALVGAGLLLEERHGREVLFINAPLTRALFADELGDDEASA